MKSSIWACRGFIALSCLFTATVRANPPANDDFSSALVITGFPVTVHGSNIEATVESGEPLPDGYESSAVKSVWYTWTARISGRVQIDTFGSHEDGTWDPETPLFHPNPSVWSGTKLETLTEIRCGGTAQSRYLNVSSGTTYRIAVFGLASDFYDEGQIVLHLTTDATASISGTVTDTNAVPLAGILVQANRWNDSWSDKVAWDFTDAAGHYAIHGLSNDAYHVVFYDWPHRNTTAEYVTEYYNDVSAESASADLVITNNEAITGIDAELSGTAQISGTVTGSGGTPPLAGIHVWIALWNEIEQDGYICAEVYTDENGDYLAAGLEPGTYHVSFSDDNGVYAHQTYLGAFDVHSGTDIVVPAGTQVPDINVSLDPAANITGTVTDGSTPLENILIGAYYWTGSYWLGAGDAYTDADGHYTISGLGAGTYRVQFMDWNNQYLAETFDNVASLDSGLDLVLATGATISNIDASLTTAASISGTVTDTNAAPLAGIQVQACLPDGTNWVSIQTAYTDNDGVYFIGGLTSDTYRVWFSDYYNETYLSEAYDNAASLDAGTNIVLAVGAAAANINASLALQPPPPPTVLAFQTLTSNTVSITFAGTIGQTYVVQRALSLTNGWSDYGDSVYCETGYNSFSVDISNTPAYLRLRMLP